MMRQTPLRCGRRSDRKDTAPEGHRQKKTSPAVESKGPVFTSYALLPLYAHTATPREQRTEKEANPCEGSNADIAPKRSA